jgi:hypothetical protein
LKNPPEADGSRSRGQTLRVERVDAELEHVPRGARLETQTIASA